MIRSKLAGLLAIVAAAVVLGVGTVESVTAHDTGGTVTTDASGEGPNR
jgi:hypothetical protein